MSGYFGLAMLKFLVFSINLWVAFSATQTWLGPIKMWAPVIYFVVFALSCVVFKHKLSKKKL